MKSFMILNEGVRVELIIGEDEMAFTKCQYLKNPDGTEFPSEAMEFSIEGNKIIFEGEGAFIWTKKTNIATEVAKMLFKNYREIDIIVFKHNYRQKTLYKTTFEEIMDGKKIYERSTPAEEWDTHDQNYFAKWLMPDGKIVREESYKWRGNFLKRVFSIEGRVIHIKEY